MSALERGLLIGREAGLFDAQMRAGRGRRQGEGHDGIGAESLPRVGQRSIGVDFEDFAVDDDLHVWLRLALELEAVADLWSEIVLHEPLLEQMRLGERAPELFRRRLDFALDNGGTGFGTG